MKSSARIKNLILSGGFLLLYLGTYAISFAAGSPIELMDIMATAGVLVGAALLLSWMPFPYYVAIVLFTCAAQYFGMMFDFYHRFWWYDVIVHFFSGILLSCMGYFLFRLLSRKVQGTFPVLLPVLFSVFFAVGCAGLWEIYEYCADTFFGLQAQSGMGQTRIDDTMQDIIAGTVSAVCYGIGLGLYLHRRADNVRK